MPLWWWAMPTKRDLAERRLRGMTERAHTGAALRSVRRRVEAVERRPAELPGDTAIPPHDYQSHSGPALRGGVGENFGMGFFDMEQPIELPDMPVVGRRVLVDPATGDISVVHTDGDVFSLENTGVRRNSAGIYLYRNRFNLIEGTNVTIAASDDSANEEVDITFSAATFAPLAAQYLVLALDASLTNERRLVLGDGLSAVDGGGGGNYTISVASARRGKFLPSQLGNPTFNSPCLKTTLEFTSNHIDFTVLDFATNKDESAYWQESLPNWNGGTITFRPYWIGSAPAGDVVWQLKGRSWADGELGDQAYGTSQQVQDLLITGDGIHIGAESPAITLAGTPASAEQVQLRLTRLGLSDADDDYSGTAHLLGVMVWYTQLQHSDP